VVVVRNGVHALDLDAVIAKMIEDAAESRTSMTTVFPSEGPRHCAPMSWTKSAATVPRTRISYFVVRSFPRGTCIEPACTAVPVLWGAPAPIIRVNCRSILGIGPEQAKHPTGLVNGRLFGAVRVGLQLPRVSPAHKALRADRATRGRVRSGGLVNAPKIQGSGRRSRRRTSSRGHSKRQQPERACVSFWL
jgi:hypothetical protein